MERPTSVGTLNLFSGKVLSNSLLAFTTLFASIIARATTAVFKHFLFGHLYFSIDHCMAFALWSQLGLRYLEAFFGLLITVMCVMFGWMVSARGGKVVLK